MKSFIYLFTTFLRSFNLSLLLILTHAIHVCWYFLQCVQKNIILSIKRLIDLFHQARTVSLKLSQESKQQTEQQNEDSQPLKYVNLKVAKNCLKAAKEHEEIDNDAKQVFVEILQLFLKPQVANIFWHSYLTQCKRAIIFLRKKNMLNGLGTDKKG